MGVHAAPTSADVWQVLGTVYTPQDRLHAAKEASRQAVLIDPEHFDASLYLSIIAATCGDDRIAIEASDHIQPIAANHLIEYFADLEASNPRGPPVFRAADVLRLVTPRP